MSRGAQRRILATAVLVFGTALTAHAQIGSGWTQHFPSKNHDVADGIGTRYTNSGGVEHLWLFSSDPSAFPGQDSGPRSELRVLNDYTSGSRQFQADFNVESGSTNCTIFQIFGAVGRATSIMLQMRNGNGTLRRYNEE